MIEHYPQLIDKYVGSRVKFERERLNIDQSQFSLALGVSLDEVQKYESGEKRISAERLITLAKILNIQVSDLFKDIDGKTLKKYGHSIDN